MRIAKVPVYKFDELTKEARQYAINKYSKLQEGDPWWERVGDCLLDPTPEQLEAAGISQDDLGDGPFFTYELGSFDTYQRRPYIQFEKIEPTLPDLFWKYLGIEEWVREYMFFEVDTPPRVGSTQLVVSYYDSQMSNTTAIREQLDYDMEEANEICEELIQTALVRLREHYIYITSEEYLADEIRVNDYEFFADGSFFFHEEAVDDVV